MTPEEVAFFEGWWHDAIDRLAIARPGLSWDRLASILLLMFIEEQDPP